jgi:hypothetical protein
VLCQQGECGSQIAGGRIFKWGWFHGVILRMVVGEGKYFIESVQNELEVR